MSSLCSKPGGIFCRRDFRTMLFAFGLGCEYWIAMYLESISGGHILIPNLCVGDGVFQEK